MKITGPLATLFAGVALAGGLFVANLNAAPAEVEAVNAVEPAEEDAAEPTEPAGAAEAAEPTEPAAPPGAGSAKPSEKGAAAAPKAPAKQKLRAAYAGRVKGGAATVAISLRDGVAIAYLCDGERIESWLKGTASRGRLKLTGKGGSRIEGTYNSKRVEGSVSAAGQEWAFTTQVVKKPSGAYRATAQVRGARVDAGWIVLADGTQVGILTRNGRDAAPAPRLDTATGRAAVDGGVLVASPVLDGPGSPGGAGS